MNGKTNEVFTMGTFSITVPGVNLPVGWAAAISEHFQGVVMMAFSGFAIGALYSFTQTLNGAVPDWKMVIVAAVTGGLYYAAKVVLDYISKITGVSPPTPAAPVAPGAVAVVKPKKRLVDRML
jgi:hypothetical protein